MLKKKICFVAALTLTISCATVQSETEVSADIWVDNWFALYVNEELVKEDSVAFKTERSFNAESFTFSPELPAQVAVIMKDYYENDSGLEYIGERGQQIGDGGFIAQFKNTETAQVIAASSSEWKCLSIHQAPLNKQCVNSNNPSSDCETLISEEPVDWMSKGFDDSGWASASEYDSRVVRPKRDYRNISWDPQAKFIWTDDLEVDNVVLCRFTLSDL